MSKFNFVSGIFTREMWLMWPSFPCHIKMTFNCSYLQNAVAQLFLHALIFKAE